MTDYPDLRAVWDFGDPAASRARFEGLQSDFAGDAHVAFRLELRTQIARAHGLERAFERAHAVLDEVEEQLEASTPVVRVRYLLERGRAFNSAGERERARALFLDAWTLAREADAHGLAVDAAHMVAIAEDGERSLEWNERAIAHAEQTRDRAALDWLGSLRNNLGWSYHALGRHADALASWEKALVWQRERNPGTEKERIARWAVARGLRALGRHAEALAIQRALLAELESAGHATDGYVHEEIAECLLALGRDAEARAEFGRAHALLASDPDVAPDRLARMKRLGESH